MNTNDENHQPKILILGSKGHGQHFQEYLWNEIPEALNVADFQIIIMEYASLSNPDNAKSAVLHNNLRDHQFAKFLFSPNSEIIIIGSPNFDFPFMQNQSWPATFWLPKYPLFDYESGDSIELTDPTFDFYIKHVASWSYCVRPEQLISKNNLQTYLSEAGIGKQDTAVIFTTIAENRYKRPIAFSMNYQAGSNVSGKVIWLPPTSDILIHEAIDLLLIEHYKIISESNPPEWLSDYPLPKEIPIREEIVRNNERIKELSRQTAQLDINLREATRFHKLLYESGEGVLEPIVREALRELGATVDEPKVKGRDDGRLSDPFGRVATLEIKGREGQLRLRDINELDRWVRDSLVMENRPNKGILIGNLKRDQPLKNRDDIFPDNCLQAAKTSEICLITTSQIYRAIQDKQNGKYNQKEFWDAIFLANGSCNNPNTEN